MILKLQFWFDFASSYSYLTAMRILPLTSNQDFQVEWRPFLLGPLFKQYGLNTSPFIAFPAKGQYMWKEMERFSQKYGIPFTKPNLFPQNSLLAARLFLAAEAQPWQIDLAKFIFQKEFSQNQDIADSEFYTEFFLSYNLDGAFWLQLANSPAIKEQLRQQTQLAYELGIFGAPSFLVKDELFWGNDRLEDALEYLKFAK